MKKILAKLASIAQDKLLHANASAIIAGIAIIITRLCGCGLESVCYGWLVGFFFGIGKEIYDEVKDKNSESADWGADLIGNTIMCIYSLILLASDTKLL